MRRIGGGPLRITVFWKIALAVYSAFLLVYTGYLLSAILSDEGAFTFSEYGLQIISTTLMFSFVGYYLWVAYDPYYSIKWDSNVLHLRFKKRNDRCVFKRSGIESVSLKLNDMHIKKKSGEVLHFDVSKMYLSYSEINHFRQEFSEKKRV